MKYSISTVLALGLFACGEPEEKDEEEEEQDLSVYCGEDDSNNLIADDGDCGAADLTLLSQALDLDCDGFDFTANCDDNVPLSYLGAAALEADIDVDGIDDCVADHDLDASVQ